MPLCPVQIQELVHAPGAVNYTNRGIEKSAGASYDTLLMAHISHVVHSPEECAERSAYDSS